MDPAQPIRAQDPRVPEEASLKLRLEPMFFFPPEGRSRGLYWPQVNQSLDVGEEVMSERTKPCNDFLCTRHPNP